MKKFAITMMLIPAKAGNAARVNNMVIANFFMALIL